MQATCHTAGSILLFVHCDSRPPRDAVAAARAALADPRTVLGGFRASIVRSNGNEMRFFSANHAAKTVYAPLLFRPLSFAR